MVSPMLANSWFISLTISLTKGVNSSLIGPNVSSLVIPLGEINDPGFSPCVFSLDSPILTDSAPII